MAINKKNQTSSEHGIIYAPWEKTFARVLTPLEEFIHNQTTSSILLVVATAVALFLANSSAFSDAYQYILHAPVS